MVTQTSRTTSVTSRLPNDLVDRLDAFRTRMQATMPQGMEFTRTDAMRVLLTLALDTEEKVREHAAEVEKRNPKKR